MEQHQGTKDLRQSTTDFRAENKSTDSVLHNNGNN